MNTYEELQEARAYLKKNFTVLHDGFEYTKMYPTNTKSNLSVQVHVQLRRCLDDDEYQFKVWVESHVSISMLWSEADSVAAWLKKAAQQARRVTDKLENLSWNIEEMKP